MKGLRELFYRENFIVIFRYLELEKVVIVIMVLFLFLGEWIGVRRYMVYWNKEYKR